MMRSHCLVILSLIFPIHSQALTKNDEVSAVETLGGNQELHIGPNVENIKPQKNDNSLHDTENGLAFTNLGSWKGRRRHHFRNAHGILNIMGWGALLPFGVIVARYFRRVPLKCDEWYNLHILCQTSGYILGAIGWGIGLWMGSSSKQHPLKTHRNLGIIIFTFATVQMLAICLQPKREDDHRRCWEIYHQVLGYALLAMIIANIFQGIHNQAHAEKWKWLYVGVLVILAFIAISLEIFRWVKPRIHMNF
ncbi:hypothetical protein P3X46_033465 [Hevea brasiliensis]|uniref:Cytochrome b561 domain-containing protein n=2 Tax=Hevea brasiliensis TaxID=3981 RepID=A0ABQ9KGI4_HEVBR|nr:hypothetical protein P3X46_033465 [Hevea brasiliensis]